MICRDTKYKLPMVQKFMGYQTQNTCNGLKPCKAMKHFGIKNKNKQNTSHDILLGNIRNILPGNTGTISNYQDWVQHGLLVQK